MRERELERGREGGAVIGMKSLIEENQTDEASPTAAEVCAAKS